MLGKLRIIGFVLFISFSIFNSSPVSGQSALRGDCLKVLQLTGGMGPAVPVLFIDMAVCKPAQPNAIPDVTIPVYAQSAIDDKVKTLNDKIDKLSGDAIDTIKKTVDTQAIKADDISRIVKVTREQIYIQLKNEISKAVQDAVRQTLQDQISAEVAKQLAQKSKQTASVR
jgi:hypothetical protein